MIWRYKLIHQFLNVAESKGCYVEAYLEKRKKQLKGLELGNSHYIYFSKDDRQFNAIITVFGGHL